MQGKLDKEIQARIGKIMERLEKWPHVSSAKALSGNRTGWYRMRIGHYRPVFRIDGETITIEKVGHRKDVYED
jgi:mRNA-degrading endonuclease RelE of RelBE toxin-antitoxin system